MVRTAPRGTVLVLAALDHATLFEAPSGVTNGSGNPITLLSIDDGLDYLLERRGCRFIPLRQLLPSGAYDGIDRLAEEMAWQWSIVDGQDLTEFEGVSYASLVQWEMTCLFARVMKSVVDARAVAYADLGDTFFIPVRQDPMIQYRHWYITGDNPESFFADALSEIGEGAIRIQRIVLRSEPARQRNGSRWRIRLSQTIQRWTISVVLPWIRWRRVYIENEYYLGPELMRALTANGGYQLVRETPAGLQHCLAALRGQGPLHIPPAWFGCRAARKARRRAVAHFCGGARDRVRSVQSNGSLQFRDVNLAPLVERKLEFLFAHRFPQLAAEQAQIRGWVKSTGIRASVLAEEVMQWSRQLIAAGRPVGMRSLCVQHSVMGFRDMGPRLGFIPVAADVTGVWGEISRRWMERAGVPPQQLAVIGCPRFDGYPQNERPSVSTKEREEFCAQVGMPPSDRLILYAETPAEPYLFPYFDYTFHNTRANLELLLRAMRQLPRFWLGIRLRQGPDDVYAALYQDIVDRYALGNVSFLPQMCLKEVLSHSELTVVSFSTVAIEALYYGHPVVVVDSTRYHRIIPIVEYGAGIIANSPEEFVEFVRRYDADPGLGAELAHGRQRLLREEVAWRNGSSSHRVVELIDNLLG